MAGRTQKARGRITEAMGALRGNSKAKDKGRLHQLMGTGKKTGRKARRKAKQSGRGARR
jgi:uncharacterized protein YjbJ (UPF0337 family)